MEHHVYFAVFGFDHDPQQLDLLLGQSADDYWCEGENYSDAVPEALRQENRWILSSQLDPVSYTHLTLPTICSV